MDFPITFLANLIINTYFNQTRCLLIFTDFGKYFDYFGNIPKVILAIEDSRLNPELVFNNFGCQGFIINCKRPKTVFENIEFNLRHTLERYNNRRYLFVPADDSVEDSLDIFKSVALQFIADANVIIRNINSSFYVMSHKYGGTKNHNDTVILDTWFAGNKSFLFGNNLYPNKLMNQFGRPLKIGTITYVPYSIIDTLDGTDISVTLELVKKLNMSIKIILDRTVEWGEVYPNFTGDGILGNLVMDRTDIGFASMFIWEAEYHYLDISKQTIKSSISCLVPVPKLIGGWITPFIAFNKPIWIAFGITVIFSVVSLYFTLLWNYVKQTKFKRIKVVNLLFKSIFLTEAMYLNQSLKNIPINFSGRLTFSVILMLSLVLGAIYDSGLASNMTIPRYNGIIRNPQDMIENNIHWGATSDAWILSIQRSESLTHKKIVELFVAESEEKLANRNGERFAFAIERLQGGNYAIGKYITEEGAKIRRILDEDLYFDFMAFYMRKSSILLPYLDDVILKVAQAGLLDVWECDAISRYSNTKIQKIIKDSVHSKRSGPIRLKFAHVEGAFSILILGLVISVVFFIIENDNVKIENK